MQVSVETEGLNRVVRVVLPTEAFEAEVDKRLRDYGRRSRIDGFRPGKVPMSFLKQRFGEEIRTEVLKEMAKTTLPDALEQENLHPVMPNRIDFDSNINNKDRVYGYTVNFEVAPEIEILPLNEYKIKRPVPTITDDDIDSVIDNICKAHSTWKQVDRPITHGDQVIIDVVITVDDEPSREDQMKLIIGQENMDVAGFDDQLLNAQPGESLNFDLLFPEDYPVVRMANQQTHFEVKIHEVNERHIPTLDELLPLVEVESIDELRKSVRLSVEEKLSGLIADRMERTVLNILMDNTDFEVPKTLLDLQKQRFQQSFDSISPFVKTIKDLEGLFNERVDSEAFYEAKRLLLIQKVVDHYGINTTDQEIKDIVVEMSLNYENPQAFVKSVYDNDKDIHRIESQLLEKKAIAHLLEQVQVEEISATFADITDPNTLRTLVSGEQPTS